MKRFLTMYKIEQRIYFRSPDVILFGLLMPVVVFALITMISGNKEAADSGRSISCWSSCGNQMDATGNWN